MEEKCTEKHRYLSARPPQGGLGFLATLDLTQYMEILSTQKAASSHNRDAVVNLAHQTWFIKMEEFGVIIIVMHPHY